jgi:ADP-heptose:LPS heptosyltransferase
VALSAPAPLLPVLSECADIDELVAQGQDPPEFDMHAPLMSLPYILGLRLESAFAPLKVPYLSADPLRSTLWRQRLSGLTKFKVGLSWQGSPTNRNSTTLEQFAPLAQVKGVQFVSLQKGIGAEQVAALRDRIVVRELGTRLGANDQLADTAAIMTNLDLVVTVDTGIAHLAGALGIPVWIALTYSADWRWMVGRDDSPWYPSARLFRQTKPKDWSGVVGKIAEALAERIR